MLADLLVSSASNPALQIRFVSLYCSVWLFLGRIKLPLTARGKLCYVVLTAILRVLRQLPQAAAQPQYVILTIIRLTGTISVH